MAIASIVATIKVPTRLSSLELVGLKVMSTATERSISLT